MKCKNYKKIKGCQGTIVWHTYDSSKMKGLPKGCLGEPVDYLCEHCGIFFECADTLCGFDNKQIEELKNK